MSFVNITPMAHPHASGLGFPGRWGSLACLPPRRPRGGAAGPPEGAERAAATEPRYGRGARAAAPVRAPGVGGLRAECVWPPGRGARARAVAHALRLEAGTAPPVGPAVPGRLGQASAPGREQGPGGRGGRPPVPPGAGTRNPGAGPAAPTRPLPRRAASPFLKARSASEALTLAAPSHQRPPFCPFAALDQQPRPPGTELPTSRGVDLGVAIILQSSDQTILLTRRTRTLRVSPNLWVPPGELPEDLAPSPGVNVPFTERYSQSQDRKIGPEMWPVA